MGEWLIAGGIIVGLATMIFVVSKPEGQVNGSVEALVAKLEADEDWQSHLNEHERKLLVNWARDELGDALRQRFTYVLGQMRTVNALFPLSDGWIAREATLRAILGLRE